MIRPSNKVFAVALLLLIGSMEAADLVPTRPTIELLQVIFPFLVACVLVVGLLLRVLERPDPHAPRARARRLTPVSG